jgi:arylsulfatase A-like enzyme
MSRPAPKDVRGEREIAGRGRSRPLPGTCRGLFLLLLAACGDAPHLERPHVLLITLDTTRADHLGMYGYERPTSPNLDALARESVLYTRAKATSSWTLPSHGSLFTGLFPKSHGADRGAGASISVSDLLELESRLAPARSLSEGVPTLAWILREAGYTTGAVVGGPYLKRPFGLDRGFDFYDDGGVIDVQGRRAGPLTDAAIAWLQGLEEGPFFLFLNYFDPHKPYSAPDPYRTAFLPAGAEVPAEPHAPRVAAALYDGEILYMDDQIGRLLRWLRERGLYESTLIVVTGDHGELLGEWGADGHGVGLFEPLLAVPLLVRYPNLDVAPRRDDSPTSLVDVLPLVLMRLGLPVPETVQGRVPGRESDRALLAELQPMHPQNPERRALYLGRYKLLWDSGGRRELFDLETDPGEREDLAVRRPELADRLQTELLRLWSGLPTPSAAPPAELDPATRRVLEELGYLDQEPDPRW